MYDIISNDLSFFKKVMEVCIVCYGYWGVEGIGIGGRLDWFEEVSELFVARAELV